MFYIALFGLGFLLNNLQDLGITDLQNTFAEYVIQTLLEVETKVQLVVSQLTSMYLVTLLSVAYSQMT